MDSQVDDKMEEQMGLPSKKPNQKEVKKIRACGLCREAGHTRKKCPMKENVQDSQRDISKKSKVKKPVVEGKVSYIR